MAQNWGTGFGRGVSTQIGTSAQPGTTSTAASTDALRKAYAAYLAGFSTPTQQAAQQATPALAAFQKGDTQNILQDQALQSLSRPGSSLSAAGYDSLPSAVSLAGGAGQDGSLGQKQQQAMITGLTQAAKYGGVNPYVTAAISPLMSLAMGDTDAAVRKGTGTAAGMALNAAGVPGIAAGPLAGVIAGLVSGDSEKTILTNAVNAGAGGLASLLGGPLGSAAYSLARMLGLNIAQGAGEQLGLYAGLVPGYEGGYWGKQGEGKGVTPAADTDVWSPQQTADTSLADRLSLQSAEPSLRATDVGPGLQLNNNQGITPSVFGQWAKTDERVQEQQTREAEAARQAAYEQQQAQQAYEQQQAQQAYEQQQAQQAYEQQAAETDANYYANYGVGSNNNSAGNYGGNDGYGTNAGQTPNAGGFLSNFGGMDSGDSGGYARGGLAQYNRHL